MAKTQLRPFDSKAKNAGIDWDWADRPVRFDEAFEHRGVVSYKTQIPNQTVESLTVRIRPYKLDEIIKAYGEPTHVAATYTLIPEKASFEYHVVIIYSLQGFTASTKGEKLPALNGDLLLEQIDFSTPGIENFFASYPVEYDEKYIVPWQGFKDFGFYCRNFRGEDCNKYLKP